MSVFFRPFSSFFYCVRNKPPFTHFCNIKNNPCLLKCMSSTSHENLKETKESGPSQKFKGPDLAHFIAGNEKLSSRQLKKISHPYLNISDLRGQGRKVYFEVRGCQMNVNDTDVAWAILKEHDYVLVDSYDNADIIFIVTCSIRDSAEEKVRKKLSFLNKLKKSRNLKGKLTIGVLGCMAERLREKLIENEGVDIVAGPDSYKDLPRLLAINKQYEESTINVLLSHDETYADITPVNISQNKVSAYVTIIRGCDNHCTFCIVPFTRGVERSRPIHSIVDEIKILSEQGIKDITLLGQNVNSYRDTSHPDFILSESSLAKNFKTVYKPKIGGVRFVDLLDKISAIDPEMRIRFTSPHPKDFPDEVLTLINERNNLCKHLHLPAQCGSTRILELMRRGYTREAYLELVHKIRSIIPNVAITSDFMCGFCSETDEEFQQTVSMLEEVRYDYCYIFLYSMREKTAAHRRLIDDIPLQVKKERHNHLYNVFKNISLKVKRAQIGQRQLVLVEGPSRRSNLELCGRNDRNDKVVFPDILPCSNNPDSETSNEKRMQPGDYVEVIINDASSKTLKGIPIAVTTLQEFFNKSVNQDHKFQQTNLQ